jgi:hypothetical protein
MIAHRFLEAAEEREAEGDDGEAEVSHRAFLGELSDSMRRSNRAKNGLKRPSEIHPPSMHSTLSVSATMVSVVTESPKMRAPAIGKTEALDYLVSIADDRAESNPRIGRR